MLAQTKLMWRVTIVMLLAMGGSYSHAQVSVYTDRAAFMARLESFVIDTFDDLPFGGGSGSLVGPHFERSIGQYTYQVNGTFHGVRFGGSPADIWLQDSPGPALGSGLAFTFTGGSPLAIGCDCFSTSSTATVTVNGVQIVSGSTFIGFVSEGGAPLTLGISSFDINLGPSGIASVNNLILGVVPEPTSSLFMAGGMTFLIGLRRRSRRLA